MRPEEINFSAFKYNESVNEELIKVISPIFSWNISTFAYFKFFPDGKYLYLCNNLDWVRHCLRHIQDNESSLGQEINHAQENEFYTLVWPTEPYDPLLKDLFDYNIWNGMSIFKKSNLIFEFSDQV